MPKGYHNGYTSSRIHIEDMEKLTAAEVKAAIQSTTKATQSPPLKVKSSRHAQYEILKNVEFEGRTGGLLLSLHSTKRKLYYRHCRASVSDKLYLICPCCFKNRQYVILFDHVITCRECLPVHYRSQSENKTKRILSKIYQFQDLLTPPDMPVLNRVDYDHAFIKQPASMKLSRYLKKKCALYELQKQYFERVAKIKPGAMVGLNS